MPMMTIRLTPKESARVAKLAKKRGVSKSEVMRLGLAALEASGERSALDAWKSAVGIVKGGPRDLSTNKKYFEGFGR